MEDLPVLSYLAALAINACNVVYACFYGEYEEFTLRHRSHFTVQLRGDWGAISYCCVQRRLEGCALKISGKITAIIDNKDTYPVLNASATLIKSSQNASLLSNVLKERTHCFG